MDSAQNSLWDHAFSFPWTTVRISLETTQLLSKVKFSSEIKIDALGHLYQFIHNHSSLNITDKGSLWRYFFGTFKGQIKKWFDAFATRSIYSWEQFMQLFFFAHHNYEYD